MKWLLPLLAMVSLLAWIEVGNAQQKVPKKIWDTARAEEYVRFDITPETKKAKTALLATRSGHRVRLYVIPLTNLKNVSSVYIPANGKYAVGNSKKPRIDWTRFANAWHLLG